MKEKTRQQAIEEQLPTSIQTEQIAIYYVVSLFLGKEFYKGFVRVEDVVHYLHSPSNIEYLDYGLIIEGTNFSCNKKQQDNDIDFCIDPDGANITFDAKLNSKKYHRCCFEVRLNKDGTYSRWGYNNKARYIVQVMEQTKECYCFELDRVIELVNNEDILPEWFIKESEWKILPHDKFKEKRNLYIRPEKLEKLFNAMDGDNPDGLELPCLKHKHKLTA